MPEQMTPQEFREFTHVAGEMAASRLHDLIADRLHELQLREGVTSADIAGRLGLSPQQVSRWMTQPRNMTVRSAGRLLAALEAYLLFDLDKFEQIIAGNGVGAQTSVQTHSDTTVRTGSWNGVPTAPNIEIRGRAKILVPQS